MVEIRKLCAHELPAAGELIALGMVDNPIHVAAWGDERVRRKALYHSFVEAQNSRQKWALGLFKGQRLLGVAGVSDHSRGPSGPPPTYVLDRLAEIDSSAVDGYRAWRVAWAQHDPLDGHLHLGPFAVHPEYQRQGLGGLLLQSFCTTLDSSRLAGYLEADRAQNLPLYQRYGFRVVHDEDVLGAHTWYMQRHIGAYGTD